MMAENTDALTITLPPELVEAIAQHAAKLVLEQLLEEPGISPYLTIAEAAGYLRCKRQRIDDLLSARRLTRHKDGRRTLILRAELDAHIAVSGGPRRLSDGDSIFPPTRATVTSPDNNR
jgi:excisionase family DNA binding protein